MKLRGSVVYDAQNAEAAKIILRHPGRYRRIQLEWARLFLENYRSRQNGQGSLFSQEEEDAA